MVRGDRAGGGVMDKTSDWGKSTLFKRRVDILACQGMITLQSPPPPMALASRKDQHICLYLDPGTRYCVIYSTNRP